MEYLSAIPWNYWGIGGIAAVLAVHRFWPAISSAFAGVKLPSLGGGKITRDQAQAGFNVAFAFMEESGCTEGMKALREAAPHFYHHGEHA